MEGIKQRLVIRVSLLYCLTQLQAVLQPREISLLQGTTHKPECVLAVSRGTNSVTAQRGQDEWDLRRSVTLALKRVSCRVTVSCSCMCIIPLLFCSAHCCMNQLSVLLQAVAPSHSQRPRLHACRLA